jgi:hypothetical protein
VVASEFHAQGDFESAASAYAHVLDADPSCALAAYPLDAVRASKGTRRLHAPPDYIAAAFDGYADTYDANMQRLAFAGATLVGEAARRVIAEGQLSQEGAKLRYAHLCAASIGVFMRTCMLQRRMGFVSRGIFESLSCTLAACLDVLVPHVRAQSTSTAQREEPRWYQTIASAANDEMSCQAS